MGEELSAINKIAQLDISFEYPQGFFATKEKVVIRLRNRDKRKNEKENSVYLHETIELDNFDKERLKKTKYTIIATTLYFLGAKPTFLPLGSKQKELNALLFWLKNPTTQQIKAYRKLKWFERTCKINGWKNKTVFD